MKTGFLTLVSTVLLLAFSREAHAYIDPGTGSYLLQLLIAGLVGSAFAVKVFWRSITAFFARIFRGKKTSEGNDDTP